MNLTLQYNEHIEIGISIFIFALQLCHTHLKGIAGRTIRFRRTYGNFAETLSS